MFLNEKIKGKGSEDAGKTLRIRQQDWGLFGNIFVKNIFAKNIFSKTNDEMSSLSFPSKNQKGRFNVQRNSPQTIQRIQRNKCLHKIF